MKHLLVAALISCCFSMPVFAGEDGQEERPRITKNPIWGFCLFGEDEVRNPYVGRRPVHDKLLDKSMPHLDEGFFDLVHQASHDFYDLRLRMRRLAYCDSPPPEGFADYREFGAFVTKYEKAFMSQFDSSRMSAGELLTMAWAHRKTNEYRTETAQAYEAEARILSREGNEEKANQVWAEGQAHRYQGHLHMAAGYMLVMRSGCFPDIVNWMGYLQCYRKGPLPPLEVVQELYFSYRGLVDPKGKLEGDEEADRMAIQQAMEGDSQDESQKAEGDEKVSPVDRIPVTSPKRGQSTHHHLRGLAKVLSEAGRQAGETLGYLLDHMIGIGMDNLRMTSRW